MPSVRPSERPRHQGRSVDVVLIEDKGSGISLRQSLAKENILTHSYNPGKADKLSRLHISSPMWNWGRVWVPESDAKNMQPKAWADPLITQVCSYLGQGSIKHDDLLDTTTQVMIFVMDRFIESFTEAETVAERARREAVEQSERVRRRRNPYAS